MNYQSVSVIIPTYCRKDALFDLINNLKKQTVMPKEVFIIDSSPIKSRLTSSETENLPNWIFYNTCENVVNIPYKRNLMIPLCTGEILIFFDDDSCFEDTIIKDYLICYNETKADGISGLVLLPGEKKSHQAIKNSNGLLMNCGPNVRNMGDIIQTKVICTANFSIKKEVLLKIGGFDEQIRGTWDDTELGYRLHKAGYKILHHPKPKTTHLKLNKGGTRGDGFNLEFTLTNIFYFHMRHSKNIPSIFFLFSAYWQYCRPGYRWLNFFDMIRKCFKVFLSYKEAKQRITSGPILIKNHKNNDYLNN